MGLNCGRSQNTWREATPTLRGVEPCGAERVSSARTELGGWLWLRFGFRFVFIANSYLSGLLLVQFGASFWSRAAAVVVRALIQRPQLLAPLQCVELRHFNWRNQSD